VGKWVHALLDVYLVRPENLFTTCSVIEEVSDQCGVLLEVEWEDKYCRPVVEWVVPAYHNYELFSRVNLQNRQAMADALRKYGII
jgi:hypothetical protein